MVNAPKILIQVIIFGRRVGFRSSWVPRGGDKVRIWVCLCVLCVCVVVVVVGGTELTILNCHFWVV